MSWKAIQWVLQQSGTERAERSVLTALAHYADGEGRCWPSQDTLAHAAGMSVRQLQRHLSALEERGVIAILRGNGRGNGSVYRILAPLSESPAEPERVTEKVIKGDENATFGAERVTEKVIKGDTFGNERVTEKVIKGDRKGRAYKDDPKTDLTTDPTTELIQSSSSSNPARKADDDDWPNPAPADALRGLTSNNRPQPPQPPQHRIGFPPSRRSAGEIAAAYSDEELRQAAWELGASLGLLAEWAGYEGWLQVQDGPTLARLLQWQQVYSDMPVERLDKIESLTGVLRAHLARNELPQLNSQQGAYLTRQIERALTVRQLADAKGYRTGVLQ